MEYCHFLVVERGDPYKKGDRIQLTEQGMSLGRSRDMEKAQVAFNSSYVSRKHAVITFNEGRFYLSDLGSKHGTRLNGQDINPGVAYELNKGDCIELVKGIVTVVYRHELDFDKTITLTQIIPQEAGGISVDINRREIYLAGKLTSIRGKERELLLLLYEHKGTAVSYDQIKVKLWPERVLTPEGVPDVGNDEINALVYRLRKRLGDYGRMVVTIAKYGFILDI